MSGGTHWVDGRWISGSGASLVSADPVTGDALWRGHVAEAQEIEAAVAAARAAFSPWRTLPLSERVACIQRFGASLASARERLAEMIARETGKPRWESLTEVAAMIGKIDISVAAQRERAGRRESEIAGARSMVRHRPHGVVAVFGPFNFPGHLPNGHIVPALLAGNTVVFKPSEHTPMVAEETAKLWESASLPRGVLNVVQGERDTGRLLAENADVDGIFFTGSAGVGTLLHRQFGGHPEKILALEMGGNNPLVVAPGVDAAAAVYAIVQSAYLSAGQRCTCARRLYLPVGAEGDAILRRLVAAVEQIRVGAWDDEPQPFMGSLISASAAIRVLDAEQRLVALGGRKLVPLRRLRGATGLLAPGLLDMDGVHSLPDEECFGPLLQVSRYLGLEQAIEFSNQTRFGLSAGLLGGEPGDFERYLGEVRAGIVNWNRPLTGASSAAPFGGIGLSGNHRASAYYAADYSAYPVASLEAEALELPDTLAPGIAL